jgi:hypothetical protein
MSGAWGEGQWGEGPWGGGVTGSSLALLTAVAIKENVMRLTFTQPVYFSTYLDPADASNPAKYAVTAMPGTFGSDGSPARAVSVATVTLATTSDGVAQSAYGSVVDLSLDRMMTSYPASYAVTVAGVYSADLMNEIESVTMTAPAVFRAIEQPSLASPAISADLANPQTFAGAISAGVIPSKAIAASVNLGSFAVDESGDYALDRGTANLQKRILRRLVTSPNGFAHLPGYGVGVPQYGKRLVQSQSLTNVVAQGEQQIANEPDVSKVKIVPRVSTDGSGLVYLTVLVQPVAGTALAYTVPFGTTP